MKIEITRELKLSREQTCMVTAHSFYNLMNVLFVDFQLLQELVDSGEPMKNSLQACRDLTDSFTDPEKMRAKIEDSDKYLSIFRGDFDQVVEIAMADDTFTPDQRMVIDEAVKNVENILNVFNKRVREAVARWGNMEKWVFLTFEEVENDLREFLEAIAMNSRGRFGVVFNESQKTEKDYYVRLDFQAGGVSDAMMTPFFLKDSMRDLVANARKYTAPGGEIQVRLVDKSGIITLEVSDNGRGIPEDDLEKVVDFGVRGSNTRQQESYGGGFGLTKAYFLCKSFGGRMWMDSHPGKGTTITLNIPHPGDVK